MSAKGGRKKVSPGRVRLDSELYRALTLRAYSQQKSVSEVINEMLKQQLNIDQFVKIGFIIIHRDLVKALVDSLSSEAIAQAARNISDTLKETTNLRAGKSKLTLQEYLGVLSAYLEVNRQSISVANNEDGSVYFTVRPGLGPKYSLFLSECLKITLDQIAEVTSVEVTDTSIHIECVPVKAQDA
jgi:hypothetical protein